MFTIHFARNDYTYTYYIKDYLKSEVFNVYFIILFSEEEAY